MVKTDKAWIFDEVVKDKKKVKKPIDSQLKVITKIGEKVVENKRNIARLDEEVKLSKEKL